MDYDTAFNHLNTAIKESGFDISEVVSGAARGADRLGEEWASLNHIPITRMYAEWRRFGRGAGPIRNEQMAKYGEALIALWYNKSSGTMDMINRAVKNKLQVYIYEVIVL